MKTIIKKSKRKTLSISVINENTVEVKAPIGISNAEIEKFIESKRNWIIKTVNNISLKNSEFKDVLNYDKAFFYGEMINYTNGYKKLYKAEAEKYLKMRIDYLANTFGFTYKNVFIRDFKSKWGSCTADKSVSLNAKLVMLNKRVIDYIIIHELCHTVYMNHKSSFHKLLSSYFADEKEIKHYLKKMGFLTCIKY